MESIYSTKIDINRIFLAPKTKSALLYNIADDARGRRIRRYLDSVDVKIIDVKPENYLDPLGYLLSRPGFEPWDGKRTAVMIPGEMLVMDGFKREDLDDLLSFFKRSSIPTVPLKAMITEHNIRWSSVQLYTHLMEEHTRFSRR